MPQPSSDTPARQIASQTLFRGLDVVSAVAEGCRTVREISERTGVTFSTTHRLASALVQIRYLQFEPRKGYRLGSRLMELGFLAYRESAVTTVARADLQALAARTLDTVHLAVLDGDAVVYLDKIGGQRPIEVSTRIGGRKPVCSTSVGKALILDEGAPAWRARYEAERASLGRASSIALDPWLADMAVYAREGYALDLAENIPGILCVGAPVRDASGTVVAAISVTSTDAYSDEARLRELAPAVRAAARDISSRLGAAG
ncbi:IclR family transcriptional regulator [Xylophilus sp.]|uniref:IclR family transcriptional regulator n=1 Tax=Xylophilus sp. TaxID=2653893 RepID=UPI0013BC2BF1|nr:IclR family transcriptional regulator [Xylophilus sp.]KAF1048986.1 MAG: Transcriptional regulator KdgR [Xylophilus sp.]